MKVNPLPGAQRSYPQDLVAQRIERLASHVRFAPSSFITVSALSPTLAIAASISAFDFLRRLHQWRASSLLETSTRFRGLFVDEDVSMTKNPTSPTSAELQFCSAIVVVSFDATVFIFAPTRQAVESDLSETLSLSQCCYMGSNLVPPPMLLHGQPRTGVSLSAAPRGSL